MRQEPIPQPSEPMQFRAIGLVRARYVPSEESLTKGLLQTTDGTEIQAVLLGRVMSLVKKHIALDQEHLWVVYPRTREKEPGDRTCVLHVQIVGVWEPETLQQPNPAEVVAVEEAPKPIRPKPPMKPSTELEDGYFSVRGEVVYQSLDHDQVVVKIKQVPRPNDTKVRSFKLQLKGNLGHKALHHFWDLQVQLQADNLVIRESACVGAMPHRRPFRKDGRGGGGGGGRRFGQGGRGGGRPGSSRPFRPERGGDRPERSDRPERGGDRPPVDRPILGGGQGTPRPRPRPSGPIPKPKPPAAE